jgi:acyl-CoA reductase-like NAD-dependent aldehyde dehydrogenase
VSAQRVIVEASVYDTFLQKFIASARGLKVGPADAEGVDVGPMISRAAADRVMDVARRTLAQGGRFALEPQQSGSIVSPGILVDVRLDSPIWTDELFGPMVVVHRAADANDALSLANDSPFGLQGSLFTRNLTQALHYAERFEVGALWVNEASRFRLDMYPFGGAKLSGFGREGVRYALEELSQLKFVGIRPI